MTKFFLLLLVLTLILLSGVSTAAAIEELNIAVMNGTAIPYAKEDHLAYGIVKMWNKAADPIIATISLIPDKNHRVDDNKYWGNYREEEDIKIEANELHIQIFCFTVPAGSELGQQTWTLNIMAEEKTVTRKVAVNLPVTKNVEIAAPSWKPDIIKLEFPPGKPDTFTVETGKPIVIVSLLDIAGDISSKKIYDVELEATLPDIFFSYPEEITVEISKPESWDFENQEFLPFMVIPVPLLTVNVPYSNNGNMYELELQLEKEGSDLKASLPFQLVVTMPSTIEAVETEVVKENATTVNETVNDSETATVTETVVVANSSEVATPVNISVEEVITEVTEETDNKAENNNWKLDNIWNIIVGGAFLLIVLIALAKMGRVS